MPLLYDGSGGGTVHYKHPNGQLHPYPPAGFTQDELTGQFRTPFVPIGPPVMLPRPPGLPQHFGPGVGVPLLRHGPPPPGVGGGGGLIRGFQDGKPTYGPPNPPLLPAPHTPPPIFRGPSPATLELHTTNPPHPALGGGTLSQPGSMRLISNPGLFTTLVQPNPDHTPVPSSQMFSDLISINYHTNLC